MMRKSSILVMSLWVLAMLVVFAVSVSYRASLDLKVAQYQTESMKAYYLAKAAIYRAIAELDKDTNNYDATGESWANNKAVFENVLLDDTIEGTAQVSYRDSDNAIVFGVQDEAAKINVNRVSIPLLQQLFMNTQFTLDALPLAETIAQWCNSEREAEENKKIFKNAPLAAPEELLLIFEYFYGNKEKALLLYNEVKNSITVYGADTLNINTVSDRVLLMLANAVSNDNERQHATSLTQRILDARKAKGHFSKKEDITIIPASEEGSLFDKIISKVSFRSNIFRIQAQGKAGVARKTIVVVYDRLNKRILYWHQN
ncbi:MAG: type II secretion system protein GspK [Candidatus Omnitrophica bacterium]|nr:type II secretion system protein GspK [Candidatus Omnitrophota bacterium]